MLKELLDKAETGAWPTREERASLLALQGEDDVKELFDAAYRVKTREVGRTVYFRGLIEFSNQCSKDCLYCGIRKSNLHVERFRLEEDDIVRAARWAWENHYGSVVLQSGEVQGEAFTALVERVLRRIHEETGQRLGITLSLGEQTAETYRRWKDAGARRYLLRIETSNESLYRRLHPDDHSFAVRRDCLRLLRECGYQVGTGVMIGLPGQTLEHLADDILFFRDMDVDMIGMGPYIPHRHTPLAADMPVWDGPAKKRQFDLALNMIAVTRLCLRNVNIAATTALQALDPRGREKGLLAGANIIMPNVTDPRFRAAYQLYEDKPCLDENAGQCRSCLARRIESIGETIGYDQHGDSPHFHASTRAMKL